MLEDKRRTRGSIWNWRSVRDRFPRAFKGKVPSQKRGNEGPEMDACIYRGYMAYGAEFLEALDGRFGCVYWDREKKTLFMARDWIGETPLHWIATAKGFVVANDIATLRDAAAGAYDYRYVRALPQAKHLEVDLSRVERGCVAETARYSSRSEERRVGKECRL